jgi:hypothetical protein
MTDIEAIEKCIEHWMDNYGAIAVGKTPDFSSRSCALCEKYWNKNRHCVRCPLYEAFYDHRWGCLTKNGAVRKKSPYGVVHEGPGRGSAVALAGCRFMLRSLRSVLIQEVRKDCTRQTRCYAKTPSTRKKVG